jgi:hypothetical protein
MIELNGNKYRLCLIDTNAISEMVKNPTVEFKNFNIWALSQKPSYIPSFSLLSIMEMRQKQEVYLKFLSIFGLWPCIILKSEEQLFNEELSSYPNPSAINPVLVAGVGSVKPDQRLDKLLDIVFSRKEVAEKEKMWMKDRISVANDIASLVSNYPPNANTYTIKEIHAFIEMAGFQQIALRAPKFAKRLVDSKVPINISAFPSLKMSLYTVFYKFYVDERKHIESDVFDILISAPTPYIDAIITERHQAEVIKKIKRHDDFIDHVDVKIIKDLR